MSGLKLSRTYDCEFKQNAVKLRKEPNKTVQSVVKSFENFQTITLSLAEKSDA